MEIDSMNGSRSVAALESFVKPKEPEKDRKKREKKDKLSQAQELKVLHATRDEECSKLFDKAYKKELVRLQVGLVKMQCWAKCVGARIVNFLSKALSVNMTPIPRKHDAHPAGVAAA